MARQYKKGSMVSIRGFEEMAELLHEMYYKSVDEAADRMFDECCDIVKNAMDTYARQSIPADLADKQTEFRIKRGNRRMFAYGFSDNDHESKMKACYLNYGTPRRSTTKGAYRGKVAARGYISNGKRSAAQKINARKKAMLKELMQRGGQK